MELTPDVTSENRHLIVVLIEDSQLEPAIAREIARYHRNQLGTRILERDRDGSGKPPATVSQEDRDIAGTLIGDGQIEHAVIGEVARHDRCGIRPGWIKYRGLECAVAVAEENRDALTDAVDSRVRNSHVEEAVAIEVTQCQSGRTVSRGEKPRGLEGPVPIS